MMTKAQLLENARPLAVNPDTPVTLMKVLDDPTVGADVLLPTVEYDATLTGGLLRICNSCLFAGNREIGSVREALVRVGNLNFARIAFIVCLEPVFAREMDGYRMDTDALWRHSLAVAYAASRFVVDRGHASLRERAFTAGILHDVGKLTLDDALARQRTYEPTLTDAAMDCALERRLVGVDHAEFGGDILDEWKLPGEIVGAVACHHDPDHAGEPKEMARALHAADEVVRMASPDADPARSEEACARLETWGYDPALVETVRSTVAEAGQDILPVLLARRR